MDDPARVRGRQPARDLGAIAAALLARDRPAAEPLAERLALEQLGDDEGRAGFVPDVGHGQMLG